MEPSKWEKVPGKRLLAFSGRIGHHHRDLEGMEKQRGDSYLDCRDGTMLSSFLLLLEYGLFPKQVCYCTVTAPLLCRIPVFWRRGVLASTMLIPERHCQVGEGRAHQLYSQRTPICWEAKRQQSSSPESQAQGPWGQHRRWCKNRDVKLTSRAALSKA